MDTAIDWAKVVNYARRVECVPPKTQYELPGVTVETHLDVPVAVVPLWHAVVTARLNLPKGDAGALKAAQKRLDYALEQIESVYPLNPSGIFIQIAYGLISRTIFRRGQPTNICLARWTMENALTGR